MNSHRFLFVHGEGTARWADRFGLRIVTAPCDQCGAMLRTTMPFAYKTLRGLRAPQCECGNSATPYCLVRDARYGDLFSNER